MTFGRASPPWGGSPARAAAILMFLPLTVTTGAVSAEGIAARAMPGVCGAGREAQAAGASGVAWSDGGALLLPDGRALVPEGIALPTRLEPDPGLTAAAAAAAQTALEGCVLATAPSATDRHGRFAGPSVIACPSAAGARPEDLTMVLLRAGAGYARAEGDAACATARRAAEAEARAAGRGIWARADAVAPAEDPAAMSARTGLYTVARGRVLATGGRDRLYVNFGSSWQQDFTVMLAREDFATILGDSLEPAALRGVPVEVRGTVRVEGGPAMELRRRGEMARLDGAEASQPRRRGR